MDTSALHNSDIKTLFLRVLTIAISLLCTAVVTLTKLQIDNAKEKLDNNTLFITKVDTKVDRWIDDTRLLMYTLRNEQTNRKAKVDILESRLSVLEGRLRYMLNTPQKE